jgi:hypothetical protein
MIYLKHNQVENADAILSELDTIEYLYSYYANNSQCDLKEKDQEKYIQSVHDHVNGKFAYHFLKFPVTDESIDNLPTNTKKLCEYILSKDFIQQAGENLKINVSESRKLNITKYSKGCFLNMHSDDLQNRKIAFLFYFNNNWKPDWGGTINFIQEDDIKCINPTHGSLLMFNVGNNANKHYVTQVSPMIQKSRYAIGGWLQ